MCVCTCRSIMTMSLLPQPTAHCSESILRGCAQAVKTELVDLKLTLGNVQSKSSSEALLHWGRYAAQWVVKHPILTLWPLRVTPWTFAGSGSIISSDFTTEESMKTVTSWIFLHAKQIQTMLQHLGKNLRPGPAPRLQLLHFILDPLPTSFNMPF